MTHKTKEKTHHKKQNNNSDNKCEEYLAGWQRAKADYENLKKETSKEKMEFAKYANANLIMELLPILDNFKTAYNQIPDAEKDNAWVVGFSYIKKQLEEVLEQNGVVEIETVGKMFDTDFHEAVGTKDDAKAKVGEILEEKKTGYLLNGKVLQVAKVIVCEKDQTKKCNIEQQ